MLPTSECAEERALRERYDAALKAYRETVVALSGASGREFEDAYERAEGIRLLFVHARFQHRYHIQEHGCVVVGEGAGAS
jgi:hypothetical protein